MKAPSFKLETDFKTLAARDPDFATLYANANGYMSFNNPEHSQWITKSILKVTFGLKLELPPDRLCPPVPSRWEYVKWLQACLDSTDPSFRGYDPHRQVIGIDIGVGASCIYALLACASRPEWHMHGTDIDATNLSYAARNIAANKLASRITLKESTPSTKLIDLDAMGLACADFVMCNPPFFASAEEMHAGTDDKTLPPSATCTGADVEMITPGGEAAFTTRLFDESVELAERVRWYSVMCGKRSTAIALIERLAAARVENWTWTRLEPGGKTVRWVVAWSFGAYRLSNDLVSQDFKIGPEDYRAPRRTLGLIPLRPAPAAEKQLALNRVLDGLDVEWTIDASKAFGICRAWGYAWSRQARRARARRLDGVKGGAQAIHEDGTAEVHEGTARDDTHRSHQSATASEDADKARNDSNPQLLVRLRVVDDGIEMRVFLGLDKIVESFRSMLRREMQRLLRDGG